MVLIAIQTTDCQVVVSLFEHETFDSFEEYDLVSSQISKILAKCWVFLFEESMWNVIQKITRKIESASLVPIKKFHLDRRNTNDSKSSLYPIITSFIIRNNNFSRTTTLITFITRHHTVSMLYVYSSSALFSFSPADPYVRISLIIYGAFPLARGESTYLDNVNIYSTYAGRRSQVHVGFWRNVDVKIRAFFSF